MGRLLFVDDNIRSLDGHYFELATLLCEGANRLGHNTEVATHTSFRGSEEQTIRWSGMFTGQRMLPWSLGVDGRSRVGRDLDGQPIGGTRLQNLAQSIRDRFAPADRRPKILIKQWASALAQWLIQQSTTPDDTLVINTGDDFQLLALARALTTVGTNAPGNIQNAPGSVHVIFHFAIQQDNTPLDRLTQLGEQVNRALSEISQNSNLAATTIHLHATTEPLARQLQEAGVTVNAVPYPTRHRAPTRIENKTDRLNILLGGLPRREKGTKSISTFLSSIYEPHLLTHRYRVSLQLPLRKWKRIVPQNLHDDCHLRGMNTNILTPESPTQPLNVITTVLGTSQYQDWLDTAELGLFLYEPQRYVARCSGVMLELMMRGIPVLVPDRCWLAEQLRGAGPDGTIGYAYRSLDEIPDLLSTIADDYEQLRLRAHGYAQTISNRHHPAQTLLAMGIEPALQSIKAA